MAELESWESAVEFGVPEDLWAGYQVRERSDDLYIAAVAEIFDVLRKDDEASRKSDLSELAKTLLIYSRSSAAKYLSGVEVSLNLLYSSSLFYLSGYPATAALASRSIDPTILYAPEENFLLGLLSKHVQADVTWHDLLSRLLRGGSDEEYHQALSTLLDSEHSGLADDPRQFFAARLAYKCTERLRAFSTWSALRTYSSSFDPALWEPFVESASAFPMWELFPSQLTAVKKGILGDENKVYSLQMPTSAGKTSLCELLIYHEVKIRKKRVLFLVPFRALAAEIKEGISKRLEKAGVAVVASYGGNIPTRSESASVETADVLIVTPEKFIALCQSLPDLEAGFSTILCDEGHLIDDEGRGLQYELLLTRLKGDAPGTRKIVFISAILPNVPSIHSWLGGDPERLAASDYKPVETDFAIVGKRGTTWQLDFNTIFSKPKNYFLARFLTDDDFRFINPKTGKSNLFPSRGSYISLACAAALKARRNGPVALFTTTKGAQGVEGLTKTLIMMMETRVNVAQNIPSLTHAQQLLADYAEFQLGPNYQLTRTLRFGIGFHHGDLPQEIRREMEEAIHSGIIDVLVCTSTLAEGVNLPIRTLVVHTIKRYDGSASRELSRRSIKNIVGRVGRAGKETRGRVIFANETEKAWIESVFRDQALEPAKGALFNLVTALNNAVVRGNITLDNELFEAQGAAFLVILDRIDSAIIDLMPADFIIEDIESHVSGLIERTLAFQYFDTDDLRNRIKEIFLIRARALVEGSTPEGLSRLRRSGSTPRFQRFIDGASILDREEWLTLSDVNNGEWLWNVVLPLYSAPTLEATPSLEWTAKVITAWMSGKTYNEISRDTDHSIDDCFNILTHEIGFVLQDSLSKTTQLAILKHGETVVSELAANWASMLQYGLGTLQQLDLFELGASDRLGVWSISRFLELRGPELRGRDILTFLRSRSAALVDHLRTDTRVPTICADRTILELRLG